MSKSNPERYYLLPGALFVPSKPHIADTVLGSCISVCLFDQKLKIGGLNHFMLPYWNGEGLASPKYGNIAMEKLLSKMLDLGCSQRNIIAKVFGGASQMQGSMAIGLRNIAIARDYLDENRIPIVAQNVGGEAGRKIRFNTESGEVLMKFLEKVIV